MKRLLAVLATAGLVASIPVAAQAASTSTGSCTSVGVTWQARATFGDQRTTWDGKRVTPVTVGWTTTGTPAETSWTATVRNTDGTVAQKYDAHGPFDYQGGAREQTFTGDRLPVGDAPTVTLDVGTYNDKVADCSVILSAVGGPSTSPSPNPTPSATPTATPTPSASPTPTPTSTTPPASGILFEDDFTGPAGALPDPGKWGDYGPCKSSIQGFGAIKCGAKETLTGFGQLSIPATPTEGQGLTTAGKFDFELGEYSAWVKAPKTEGYWPAVWTENRPVPYVNGGRVYGETDAYEGYTWNKDDQYAHNGLVHSWNAKDPQINWGSPDNYCSIPGVDDFGDDYHKVTMRIEPEIIKGFIDGVQCGETVVKPNDKNKPWPFGAGYPNYLILNLAVGGAGGAQPTPPNADVFLVDRIEVRSLAAATC